MEVAYLGMQTALIVLCLCHDKGAPVLLSVWNCLISHLLFQALIDHENYYFNITDANLNNNPKWQFEYTAKVHSCATQSFIQTIRHA